MKILVATVGKNGFAEFLAIAGRAARIGKKNGVTVGRVELREMVEGSGILADRAAMRIEQRGDFLAGGVVDGSVKISGDGGAVLAFEMDVIGLGETELREERIVSLC